MRRAQCPVPARLSTRISENLHGRARQAPCKQRPVISTSHAGVTFRGALPAGALRFQEPHISVLPGGGFAGMEAAPHVSAGSPIFDRLTGKSFWKDGVRGGRTFFQKGFPPRRVFPHFKSSSAACGLALPARFPLRNGYPLLRRPFGVTPGRAPHQARPPAGSGETSGAGGALAVVPQPVPLFQQKKSPVDRGQSEPPAKRVVCSGPIRAYYRLRLKTLAFTLFKPSALAALATP
ncbi:hypothetical protein DESPIGER_1721 [Desulfovibrio piger]|uniref:Uncharacterized protein n=1 Tax=Desulfovibrio piger TaxID=901 RepID=A0A1K1LFS5_9BACT|nr:hypothetical protein DESPIGER_1721 [Desulfovibrio piger]